MGSVDDRRRRGLVLSLTFGLLGETAVGILVGVVLGNVAMGAGQGPAFGLAIGITIGVFVLRQPSTE